MHKDVVGCLPDPSRAGFEQIEGFGWYNSHPILPQQEKKDMQFLKRTVANQRL
jgi:hypothetical protein